MPIGVDHNHLRPQVFKGDAKGVQVFGPFDKEYLSSNISQTPKGTARADDINVVLSAPSHQKPTSILTDMFSSHTESPLKYECHLFLRWNLTPHHQKI